MASVTDYNWTHLRSDPCHYEDDLRITTGAGRYRLGNPANGTQGVFVPEPTTRLQTWGQSQIVTQQKTDVESDLLILIDLPQKPFVVLTIRKLTNLTRCR